jgi:hypothetical protein
VALEQRECLLDLVQIVAQVVSLFFAHLRALSRAEISPFPVAVSLEAGDLRGFEGVDGLLR